MNAELVVRLRGVIPRLARQFNETSTGADLTPTQYSVLALVRVRGPLGLAELTELEGLNPTMLSRIVKVLDERGLIRRLPDPSDMRAARVEVTPEGARLHEQVREQRTQVLSEWLERLPVGDRRTAARRRARHGSAGGGGQVPATRHLKSPPAKRYSWRLYRRQILVMVSFSLSSQAHH